MPRAAAMTLIELLTVIAIITLLAGIILTASFSAISGGNRRATEGLFEEIAQALEQYKSMHHMYVPADPADSSYVAETSSAVLCQALEIEGQLLTVSADRKTNAYTFTDPNTLAVLVIYSYLDAWGTPIIYECRGPRYKLYKLISCGPDRAADSGDEIAKE